MKIAIKTVSGVAIMTLFAGANVDTCIAQFKEANPGEYISHREISESDIPADRSKRDQWHDNNPGSQIDIGPDPPPAIPQNVSRFQALAALESIGQLDTIEAIMSNPATPKITKLAYQNALIFERQSPTVLAMAAALGLTDKQLDDLFIAADRIKA